MKRLLRQGWVRAGIPIGSIESIADHSWSVAVLSFILVTIENEERKKTGLPKLSVESTVLSGLLHDINESEYFDIDKSIDTFLEKNVGNEIREVLERQSTSNLIEKLSNNVKDSFFQVLNNHESEEFQLARAADLIDLILQTKDYAKKGWLDKDQRKSFMGHSLKELKELSLKYASVQQVLKELLL